MADVEISPYRVRVEVRDGETLLRAIVRSGYKYRYGCRRGGCGFCKVHLVLGEVTYERPIDSRVLTDDEKVSGICLSCRAVPLTNVVIELQEGDRLRGAGVAPVDGSAVSSRAEKVTGRGRPAQASSVPGPGSFDEASRAVRDRPGSARMEGTG